MEKITLIHYSNKDFSGYIRPDFFAENSYTGNSARISNIKRIFFYIDTDKKESIFNGSQFIYKASIDKNKLYDLCADKKHLAGRINGDIYSYFKAKGYKGLIGNNGLKVVCLFDKIKIEEKITL